MLVLVLQININTQENDHNIISSKTAISNTECISRSLSCGCKNILQNINNDNFWVLALESAFFYSVMNLSSKK